MKENPRQINGINNQEEIVGSGVEELEQKTQKLFGKEWKKEGLPDVRVDIFYSTHATKEDAVSLKELFEKSDVYIPEEVFWTKQLLEIMQKVSMGEVEPKRALKLIGYTPKHRFYDFALNNFEMIFNSRKPITFADIPLNHPWVKKRRKWEEEKLEIQGKTFEAYLDMLGNHLQNFSSLQKERDEFIISQLPLKIKEILETNPELKEKEGLDVLMSLGSQHTGVFHELSEMSTDVKRTFHPMPHYYNFGTEVMRYYRFGKRPSGEVLARAFLEAVFDEMILYKVLAFSKSTNNKYLFLRKFINQFSFNDAKTIFESVQQGRDINEITVEEILKHNAFIPNNDKGLEEFLGIRKTE